MLLLPMVAPEDLGDAAARRLLEPVNEIGPRFVEGSNRCTPRDVADTSSAERDLPVVEVELAPREAWEEAFTLFGFSKAASVVCVNDGHGGGR